MQQKLSSSAGIARITLAELDIKVHYCHLCQVCQGTVVPLKPCFIHCSLKASRGKKYFPHYKIPFLKFSFQYKNILL